MLADKLIKSLTPAQLFLTDSLGALLSIAAGLFVSRFEKFFGISPKIMYILCGAAGFFCIYSFTCFLLKPKKWRTLMKAIAIANIPYCCTTIGLIAYLRAQITSWGITFFIVEIIIVCLLASAEFKKAWE